MTAKDKATDIYHQYADRIATECHPTTVHKMSTQCAIIHVKGIIEALDVFPRYQMTSFEIERLDYWKQVLTILKEM